MPCNRICTGQFFGTWEAETESLPLIANNYYLMPIRLPRNLIVQTNNAVSPLLRCTQQSFKSNHLAQHAEPPSWRFETLSKIIPFANTIHETINVPNYISPFKNPFYSSNSEYILGTDGNKKTPMKYVPIQVSITVYRPAKLKIYTKSGPWGNNWVKFDFKYAKEILAKEQASKNTKQVLTKKSIPKQILAKKQTVKHASKKK